MFGNEIDCLFKMAGIIAIILVNGRDILIVWDIADWMSEFIAFRATHDCSDAMFWVYWRVLLSVLIFSAASMLLI